MDREAAFRRAALARSREHPRSFPWRATVDPYAVLIGEVLLQRTRAEHVPAVYEEFLRRWPSPDALAAARTPSIAAVIRPLGFSKRAPILKRLGAALVAGGGVPDDTADLLGLPGVGPYAAHAVPVFTRDASLPLVDWVIARVLRRYFGLPIGTRPNADRELWALAERLVRRGRAREFWLGTLDFAAAVCRPRPLCQTCPLRSSCSYVASAPSST